MSDRGNDGVVEGIEELQYQGLTNQKWQCSFIATTEKESEKMCQSFNENTKKSKRRKR